MSPRQDDTLPPRPGQRPGPINVRIAVPDPTPEPAVPFARMPHGIASDKRIAPVDRLVALALLHWALDGPTCQMADWSVADYLGVSLRTVERSMKALERVGYVRRERVKPTPANMTGRVVFLVWVEDPSIIPQPPARKARRRDERLYAPDHPDDSPPEAEIPNLGIGDPAPPVGSATRGGPSDVQGPPPVADRVRHPWRGGSATRGGEGPPPVAGKEESSRKNREEPLENGKPKSSGVERERSQAEIGTRRGGEAPSPKVEADQLTEGQSRFLDSLDPAARCKFDGMSDGKRGQMLKSHANGFDPGLFEFQQAEIRQARGRDDRPGPATLAELVGRIADGDGEFCPTFAQILATDFGTPKDQELWPQFLKIAGDVKVGIIDPEAVIDSHRKAMGPKARNRGAIFKTEMVKHGWRPS